MCSWPGLGEGTSRGSFSSSPATCLRASCHCLLANVKSLGTGAPELVASSRYVSQYLQFGGTLTNGCQFWQYRNMNSIANSQPMVVFRYNQFPPRSILGLSHERLPRRVHHMLLEPLVVRQALGSHAPCPRSIPTLLAPCRDRSRAKKHQNCIAIASNSFVRRATTF